VITTVASHCETLFSCEWAKLTTKSARLKRKKNQVVRFEGGSFRDASLGRVGTACTYPLPFARMSRGIQLRTFKPASEADRRRAAPRAKHVRSADVPSSAFLGLRHSGYGLRVKKLATWFWRFVALLAAAAVLGGTPKWLQDKVDEEDERNRLV
jgi:hypothetical protein